MHFQDEPVFEQDARNLLANALIYAPQIQESRARMAWLAWLTGRPRDVINAVRGWCATSPGQGGAVAELGALGEELAACLEEGL